MHCVSNIMGGLTFTYGEVPIINSFLKKEKNILFSGSPSRNNFPRGFLWDDGFHLLLICKIDKNICKKILNSWLDNIDIYGYIARE